MEMSKEAIGARIRDAAKEKGVDGPADLCRRVLLAAKALSVARESDGREKLKQTLTPQSVSNWLGGKVVPSWDMLAPLCQVLGVEGEWLLFGSKRREQLKKERQYLVRVNDEELAWLSVLRDSNVQGQKTILKLAKDVAEDHPATEADIHHLRRRDDRLSK